MRSFSFNLLCDFFHEEYAFRLTRILANMFCQNALQDDGTDGTCSSSNCDPHHVEDYVSSDS